MGQSTEELNQQIAANREDLAYDVDALQERVSPSAVVARRKAAARGRLQEVKDRVMGSGQHAMGSAKSTTGSASTTVSNAAGMVEQRVEGSPLGAGLVAFGIGLVVAGLAPATDKEAHAAAKVKEVAQDKGQPLADAAKSAARDVGDQMKQSGQQAAAEVKDAAQQSADRVKDEASSSTESGTGSPTVRTDRPLVDRTPLRPGLAPGRSSPTGVGSPASSAGRGSRW